MGPLETLRFTVCTYNLWKDERWPERELPLRRFMEFHRPDILCLQELRPQTRELLDRVLDSHQRIDDPFPGWLEEGNIYWNRALFDLIEYGAEEIGILEQLRRLFWARLRPRGTDATLLVTTAHYTWPGNSREKADQVNVRTAQAAQTVDALDRLAGKSEPVLFMGDLNDYYHPLRRLRESGLVDCFAALGRIPAPTRPTLPTDNHTPEVVDWMLHRGPLQPMSGEAVDFFVGDLAPSDHKPLLVTYRMAPVTS